MQPTRESLDDLSKPDLGPDAAARPRLLMITLRYAPCNTSGSLRMVKLTKYLARHGWDTSVLTVPVARYPSIDPDLLRQLPPNVRIQRAPCWDARTLGVAGKYPAFAEVPDRYVSWLPGGVYAALRGLRVDDARVILSSSPVVTAHLIGRAVQAATGKPWIAEFRDPWRHSARGTRLRRGVERRLQAHVLRHADRILASTPELLATLESLSPHVRSKGHVLPNGYDEEDLQEVDAASDSNAFLLTHAGLLSRDYRDPAALLRAVRSCLDRGALPPTTSVNLVGGAGGEMTAMIRDLCTTLALRERVQIGGRVPHRQAIAAMQASTALVLLQGELVRTQVPAKIFEYLRTERPILALAPARSATANFLRGFAGVYHAAPDDSAAIERQLVEIANDWRSGIRAFDRRDGLRRFTREATARELAAILTEVSRARSGIGG